MSLPSIFFTATEAVAKDTHLNNDLPHDDVEELGGIDTLKMSTLWAIIDEKTWDVDSMDRFETVYATEEEWMHRIPDELTKKLALLDDSKLTRVSKEWAATDEMMCEPAEAEEVFRSIAKIAARSILTHRNFYLYTSL
jgi:hypothetical protein